MKKLFFIFFVFFNLFTTYKASASPLPTIDIINPYNSTALFENVFFLIQKEQTTPADLIIQTEKFLPLTKAPTFFIKDSISLWLRFKLNNKTKLPTLFLSIKYFNISDIELYKILNNKIQQIGKAGNQWNRKITNQNDAEYSLDLFLPSQEVGDYLLQIKSIHPVTFPLFIESAFTKDENFRLQHWAIGIYIGLMMSIFFYNLFLYFSTKDKQYFTYTLYVFTWSLAQLAVSGFGFKYIWFNYPIFNKYAVVTTSALGFISIILFSISFLHLNTNKKFKYVYLSLLVLIGVCVLTIICNFLGKTAIAYNLLSLVSLITALSLFFSSIILIKKYKASIFYLIAWSFFLISLIILTLRNISIIPYNNFTVYASYIGSALETILLSFALANKINILRNQAEQSRARELATAKENEKLVQEQNIVLEKQVAERTVELQKSNQSLNKTLVTLKETQAQLVQAEKMSSLGILTAGVAHEINNPINFVSSNLKPLELDISELLTLIEKYELLHKTPVAEIPKLLQEIDTLKQELDLPFLTEEIHTILKTIGEGAKRTTEIVEGLRNFSRLDESDFKHVNIHEGIDSTLMILRSHIPNSIQIIKQYNADGNIDCFPSQLNQAFMNIIMNALQAIQDKKVAENESITITTNNDDNFIYINIADTATGMTDEVKNRIFDPFFTTKDVGEGTGLGLSIVHKIIEKHQGKIDVESTIGKGTVFNIQLPRKLSNPS